MVLDEWPWNIVHFGAWSLQPQGLVTYNSQKERWSFRCKEIPNVLGFTKHLL